MSAHGSESGASGGVSGGIAGPSGLGVGGGGTMPTGAGQDLQQRLEAIANVEKKIDELLQNAQGCLQELTKDKQISKQKMEESSLNFRRTLNFIESELSGQLQYLAHVCVGAAHQGSTFASEKNTSLAESAVRELHEELQRLTNKHFYTQESDESTETAESGRETQTQKQTRRGDEQAMSMDTS